MFRWRELEPGERETEPYWAAVGAAGFVAAWTHGLWKDAPLPACPLKSGTGIPCCFCGGTRAAHALARARPGEALRMNPLAASLVFGLGLLWLYAIGASLLRPRRRLRPGPAPGGRAAGIGLRVAVAIAFLANWAYLIADGR